MNRHFIICFFISTAVPFLGGAIAWLLGQWWEKKTHDGEIPDDIDTMKDLIDNWNGIKVGTAFGCLLYLLIFMNS
jgi:membrane protein YqaA with SNARE-associated domain